jgi:hypothetical protein
MPLMDGIYGHGSVGVIEIQGAFVHFVDRLIFSLTIAQFPARAPLIEMIASLSPESITVRDFYGPPDQQRGLILLERFFNGFVSNFPKPENIASRFVGPARCAPRSPITARPEYSRITR